MSMLIAKRSFMALAGVVLLVVAGCGGGTVGPAPSTSTDQAQVKGIVTLKGKPVTSGEVSFDGANSQRKVGPGTAKIGEGGTYSLKTYVGTNSVTVRGPEIDKDPTLATNGRQVDVKPGDSEIPIELP